MLVVMALPMFGLQNLYVGLLESRASVKHRIVAPLYQAFAKENAQVIPDLPDFMKGAKQAFVHVNKNLVSVSSLCTSEAECIARIGRLSQ